MGDSAPPANPNEKAGPVHIKSGPKNARNVETVDHLRAFEGELFDVGNTGRFTIRKVFPSSVWLEPAAPDGESCRRNSQVFIDGLNDGSITHVA